MEHEGSLELMMRLKELSDTANELMNREPSSEADDILSSMMIIRECTAEMSKILDVMMSPERQHDVQVLLEDPDVLREMKAVNDNNSAKYERIVNELMFQCVDQYTEMCMDKERK